MPRTKLFSAVRIVIAITLWIASPALAQSVRVPGTRVSLVPPDGFAPSQQYPGFQREDDHATIMVTELPTPAAEMLRGMTKEALASRGMMLVAARDLVINDRPARLFGVRQKAANGDVLKWMLIAGDRATTIMIVAMFPADSPSSVSTAIEQSLLSASWGAVDADVFDGLPFRVSTTARLRVVRRVSNMLTLTEPGTIGSPGPSEAIYLVGHSIGRGGIGDVRGFSEARAKETTLVTRVGNFTGRAIRVDGLDAFELEADATDTRSGAPMRLYQVIIPDDTGYFIAQGLTRAERARDIVSEFRGVTASFRRTSTR